MASQPFYEQVEQDSDFYEPAVYELLTFYHSLETVDDPLTDDFIPLTTVQSRSPKDVKIFAVGLLPPSSMVTGRLLDRSASVRVLDGSYDDLIAATPDAGSSSYGDTPGQTSGVSSSTSSPAGPTSDASVKSKRVGYEPHSDEFWDKFVVMCNRLGCQPEELARVIQSESGFDPTAVAERNGVKYGRGLIQLIHSTAVGKPPDRPGLGMTDEQFDNLTNTDDVSQLQWVEKFYGNRAKGKNAAELKAITFGGFNNQDGSIYNGAATEPEYKNPAAQVKAYEANKDLDRPPPPKGYLTPEDVSQAVLKHPLNPTIVAALEAARGRLGMGGSSAASVAPDQGANSKWASDGSDNAAESARANALKANRKITDSQLGQKFMEQQTKMIQLTQSALAEMAATPPLRLMVNPQSFRVSAEQIITSGNWGRNGPIVEHWGSGQDRIEGSGKVAGFYSMDATLSADGPGLGRNARQFSASYQNLLSLWLIYRSNGGIYLPDFVSPAGSKNKNLSVVGSVYLYYDDILYIGSFDTFSLTETDTSPFTLEYSFSFTVQAWYLLDHLDDPQYTYSGAAPATISTRSNSEGSQDGSPVNLPAQLLEIDALLGLGSAQIAPANDGSKA